MVKSVRNTVRLTGKDLFVYCIKGLMDRDGKHICGGCTNKRVLSRKTGIDYNTLMWNFTRKGKRYYEDERAVVVKIRPQDIEKGGQSLSRKGKGGMERFMGYIIKERISY